MPGRFRSTIQNMPEEQFGAVYGSGDGSTDAISTMPRRRPAARPAGLNGLSSSIFITRDQKYTFAASQSYHVLTVLDASTGSSYPLSLPGVYRVSVNTGGSIALAFVENSNYIYYPMKLTAAQTVAFSGGASYLAQGRDGL